MDAVIYTAMSGANAAVQQQAVLANNLANASTQGFKAELNTYRSVPLRGEGASTRVFAMEATAGHLSTPGAIQKTGRSLDVAAKGNAWFAVQSLDGSEAYTRAGSFDISAQGQLVNASGLPVLSSSSAPISIPAASEILIGADGSITAKQGTQPGTVIGKLKLVSETPEQRLHRGADGLYRSADAQALDTNPAARVEDGALEGSNVNPIEAMVAMIQVGRQFEVQMRLLQSAETNDKSASQLLSLNG